MLNKKIIAKLEKNKEIECEYYINTENTYVSVSGYLFKNQICSFNLEYRINTEGKNLMQLLINGRFVKKNEDIFSINLFFKAVKLFQNF